MSAGPVQRAQEIAAESRFQWLTRVGFFGRGVLYLLIGLLVVRTGRTEDMTGALEYLNEGAGQLLLAAIAAGMVTYGLWRLADAAVGMENPGSDRKALGKRAAAGIIGCIYLYLAYKAVRVLLGHSSGESDDTVLDLPGGFVTLWFAAAVLATAGLRQLITASKCTFLRKLDHRAQAPLIKWLGRIGYAARGVIFLVIAYMIAKAAVDGREHARAGTEQALDFLSGPVLYAVSLGLILFGAFSIIEALFRRIQEPPVDQIKQDVRDAVGG